jgi:hypothetical protein
MHHRPTTASKRNMQNNTKASTRRQMCKTTNNNSNKHPRMMASFKTLKSKMLKSHKEKPKQWSMTNKSTSKPKTIQLELVQQYILMKSPTNNRKTSHNSSTTLRNTLNK